MSIMTLCDGVNVNVHVISNEHTTSAVYFLFRFF